MLTIISLALFGWSAYAHSWVERAYVTRGDALVGQPGFPRGNVLRSTMFLDQDMMYHLPPDGREPNIVLPGDNICKETQRSRNYTAGSPMLIAHAGDRVLLMYQENGHVTKIKESQSHNGSSGVVTVVGTLYPSSTDTFQAMMSSINENATSEVLRIGSFDDGSCYQANETPEAMDRRSRAQRPHIEAEGPDNLWCGQDIQLPSFLQPGNIYTLYWIWCFDGVGFEEKYTTCLDVEVVA